MTGGSMNTQIARIDALKSELKAIKEQAKHEKIAAKVARTWVNATKSLPERSSSTGAIRVIAWLDGTMVPCWYAEDEKKWYSYNGTWCHWPQDEIYGVTHWMPIDWMTPHEWPRYGPGIANRLRYYWKRFTQRASNMAYANLPKTWGYKAQLDRKPVFYRDHAGRLTTGLHENLPSPFGYEKIVCGSALEAERLSGLQRRQEQSEHRIEQERRGSIESEFQREIRSELHTKMANARNATNREFLRRALERNENRTDPTRYEKESFLHSEGYEQGH
jgi:hypothetical protein